MSNGRAKNWCFTLNNYSAEDEKELSVAAEQTRITYICYGREVGGSGTPHLQGYFECGARVRLPTIKRWGGSFRRMHLEVRRGTAEEAKEYCSKDGDFVEHGTFSGPGRGQGKRTDLDDIRDLIRNGASTADVADKHFGSWCRYRKSFDAYSLLHGGGSVREVAVYFLWGAAGCGKTRLAYETSGQSLWISSCPKLQWFDGYAGEDHALLDDFRGECSESWILRCLDIYPLRVPIKGSYVNWKPKTIWITSNVDPRDMYGGSPQWLRRLTKVYHFSGPLNFSDEDAVERVRAYLGVEIQRPVEVVEDIVEEEEQ